MTSLFEQIPADTGRILDVSQSVPKELLGTTFKDQTRREFKLEAQDLNIGTHVCTPSAGSGSAQNFVLGHHTHSYIVPWVKNTKTKYLVIESANLTSTCNVAMGLAIKAYKTDAMDPLDITDVPSTSMFCYYPTPFNKDQYSSANVPLLLNSSLKWPEYRDFDSGRKTFYSNYPVIGYRNDSDIKGWYDDSDYNKAFKGGDNFRLRYGNDNYYYTPKLSVGSVNGENAAKAIVIIFKEPINPHSVRYVGRTFHHTNDKPMRTSKDISDRDVLFRNNSYVTAYNQFSHCIAKGVLNDSILRDGKGVASMKRDAKDTMTSLTTNTMSLLTFGPSTPL